MPLRIPESRIVRILDTITLKYANELGWPLLKFHIADLLHKKLEYKKSCYPSDEVDNLIDVAKYAYGVWCYGTKQQENNAMLKLKNTLNKFLVENSKP